MIDVYHIYNGSGHFCGLDHLATGQVGLVHINDFPANPKRNDIEDEHRVYPGDGEAPWNQIILSLQKQGYRGMLSLELFNPKYWAEGSVTTARKGLEKITRCIEIVGNS